MNLIRKYYSSDEDGGGVAVLDAPIAEVLETPEVETPVVIAPVGLTEEQIARVTFEATQRAIAEAQAASALRDRQQQQQQQRQATSYNPTADAVDAVNAQIDLYDEIVANNPDLNAEARSEVKAQLRQFKSVEAIQRAKENGLHTILADAAYGKAVRTGKIVPKGSPSMKPEPAASEPEPSLSRALNDELKEMEAKLGVKFSPEDLKNIAKGIY